MKASLIQEDLSSASTNNDLAIFQSNSHRSVFVRDLPFACTSQILKSYFFESLGVTIERALVCENKKGRNLQFGCVLFANEEHVQLAIERLNNSRFQGRNIRILRFDPAAPSETSLTGSIHVSFKTIVPKEQLTEEILQEVFAEFGEVEHVSIRSLKFSDDGLQGGYGFLSFKTEEENKRAVELCCQRVINDVIFDCQWSQKNPRDRNPDRKNRGDRINVQKIAANADQSQSNGNDPMPHSSVSNARKDRTIRASSNASSKLLREEFTTSSKQQIKVHENVTMFSEVPPNPTFTYPVPPMPAMTAGLSSFPTQSPGAQHYSPPPGYANSPIPSLNYSPILSSNVLHGSSIPPQSHQMQAQPTMQLIPQQYSVASSQQYYYGVPPNPNESHQSPTFTYPTHQGQQVSSRYSASSISHHSSTHQPPNPLPNGYYVSLPPNSPSPTHSGMSSQPQYPSAVRPDDRSPPVFNRSYNNPSYSIPQPLSLTPEMSHPPPPVMVAGMHVNIPPQRYYSNYYPVNSSIPVPLYSSSPHAQPPTSQSTPGTHRSNPHPPHLHPQNHHRQNNTPPSQGNDWHH